MSATDFETERREGSVEEPHVCRYCDRPFAREEWLALHHGIEHEERLSEDEREACEAAREAEEADLRVFRLQAIAVLVLIYFGFLLVYAFAT